MSTVLEEPCALPKRKVVEVTREEVAVVARMLQFVDRKDRALPAVSQWLLIWEQMRELCWKYGDSSATTKQAVAEEYRELLTEAMRVGKKLMKAVASAEVSPQLMMYATGCSLDSVEASLKLMQDAMQMHFGEQPSPELIAKIWRKFGSGRDTVVSAGA